MSAGVGSSSWGFFWAARKSLLVDVDSASSSAWMEDSRPTTNGAIMWGKTTMSRSGTRGSLSDPAVVGWLDFISFKVLRLPGCWGGAEGREDVRRASTRLSEDRDRVRMVLDEVPRDDAFLDVVVRGDLVHHVEHQVFDDDLQAPRPDVPGQGFLGDRLDGVVGETQLDVLELQHRLVLLDERVLGLAQDLDESRLIQLRERRAHRQPADELRDHAELDEVLGVDLLQERARALLLLGGDLRSEAHRLLGHAAADDVLESHERAAAEEQDVRRVDLDELLVG